MNSQNEKLNKFFVYWLISSLILIFFTLIIGGLTRLTNSGLSITEWELLKGIFPPLTQNTWEVYFQLYKEIPQYKLLNYNMSLNEFKIIFFWEYLHRIIARIIGLFFLIPLLFFHFTKKINQKYLYTCNIIFMLILLQGLIGWYMVKSGLVNNITVSHFRLSLHLITAFIIISIIFWTILNIKNKKFKFFFNITKKNVPFLILISLIFLQVIFGAFVSGLDAGQIYQTWPYMNNTYFPEDTSIKKFVDYLDFNNPSLVQFYHRNLAYLITIYVLILSYYIYKNKIFNSYKPLSLLILIIILQIILGVLTLLSGLNIYLASAHQICSVLLVFSAINLYYFNVK